MLAAIAMATLVAGAGTAEVGVSPTPPESRLLKKYTIDLDLAPEKRWVQPALDHKNYIKLMVATLKGLFLSGSNYNITTQILDAVVVPDDLKAEMQGVADAVGVTYRDALLANMFYEVSVYAPMATLPKEWQGVGTRSCTSIVAQHSNGTIFHGRNQDYPPPFSPLQFDALVTKGGKLVYEGTTFAGTVGIGGTCVVPGGFSVSIDARGAMRPDLATAVASAKRGDWIFPLLTRAVCERAGAFEDSVKWVSTQPMISPGYFIMAGVAPGEGAVVTHNATSSSNLWRLKDGYPKGDSAWFLLETNYDHWEPAPKSDDRRDPGIKSMEAVGPDALSFDSLWTILSTKPVFNLATIHTDFAVPATGEYRTYLRNNVI
eukprot:Hpha_TRINITY_DN15999_c1_g9::TRINITY_DN15999_c1_g9_i1::g.71310::m.71310/K13720/NAAA; N-acylethanolamine-hydrolysing acid amidase